MFDTLPLSTLSEDIIKKNQEPQWETIIMKKDKKLIEKLIKKQTEISNEIINYFFEKGVKVSRKDFDFVFDKLTEAIYSK